MCGGIPLRLFSSCCHDRALRSWFFIGALVGRRILLFGLVAGAFVLTLAFYRWRGDPQRSAPAPAPRAMATRDAVTATPTANASEWTRSPKLRALVERLRSISDLIVIDSPPLLAVHDTKKLAPLADGALFVVHWAKTPREASDHAARSLRDCGVPILGTILTRANPGQYRYYTYGYGGAPALAKYYED